MSTVSLSTTVFGDRRPAEKDWALLSTHGFSDIELALPSRKIDDADRSALAALNTKATAAGVRVQAISVAVAEAEAGINAAAELGCRLLVVRAGTCRLHASDRSPADPHVLRHLTEPLVPDAASRGVTLAFEFPSSWSASEIVDFLEALDGPAAGVCLDLGHANMREGAPEAIEQLAGYVQVVHMHDNLGRSDDHRPPFAGAIEWPAVLMELEKTGYLGPLVMELAGEPDAETAIARAVGARTRLQAILDDLAQPMVFPE